MSGFFSEIAKMSGLPFEVLDGGYKVINFGGKALYIEGIKGIVALTPERISARLGKTLVEVLGKGLDVKMISRDDIMILGEIKSVSVGA